MAIHLQGVGGSDSQHTGWYAPGDTAADPAFASAREPRAAGTKPSVSIVVAARNNGAYLADALRSAVSQSIACEVVYVDDGSEDDSVTIAARFPTVRTIRRPREGVCASRNVGLAESRGQFVLFLDGDDQLPYRYVESALRALDTGASFSYSPAQAFGLVNYFWDVPDWDGYNIWARNFVHTSALHRRADLLAVGGWQEGIGTAWDWNLALRYARAGYRGQPIRDCFLLYRQHPHSFSRQFRQRADADIPADARFFWLTRHALSRFRIGLVLSDRVFDLWVREWLPAVRRNLQYYRAKMAEEVRCGPYGSIEPRTPALQIAYTGQRRLIDIHRAIDRFADEFDDVQVTKMSFAMPVPARGDSEGELTRRNHLSTWLAEAYNRLLDPASEVVWFLEDDVIPPDHAYHNLVRALLGADDVNAKFAVSGCYRNRHAPRWYVLADWPSDDPKELRHYDSLQEGPFYVDVSGTGCLAIFRPFAPHRFDSHVGQVAAHDWAWCRRLAQYTEPFRPAQRKVLALPSVVCRHYQDSERFV